MTDTAKELPDLAQGSPELPPLVDRAELVALLQDLASVNLSREACERQANRMADDLIARGLTFAAQPPAAPVETVNQVCDLQTLLEIRDFLQDISTGADVTDASRDSATEFVALLDAEYAEKWESSDGGVEIRRHADLASGGKCRPEEAIDHRGCGTGDLGSPGRQAADRQQATGAEVTARPSDPNSSAESAVELPGHDETMANLDALTIRRP